MTLSPSSKHASELLRQLPSVHELLAHAALVDTVNKFGHNLVRQVARECVESHRQQLLAGSAAAVASTVESLATEIVDALGQRQQKTIRRVINATGILLHTGLGRAPLPAPAVDAVLQATGYCNVELDLHSGERTKRHEVVQEDLCALTGAEAAMVVNNNAGATGLVLATFAAGRELVISHGQLIEIGGGFRLPDVFRAYGAKLRAVGTTNRTRLADYEAAINEHTGAVMVIHTSNYQVVGFTEQPPLEELVELTRDRDFPLVHDIGSGALVEFLCTAENDEPLVRQSVEKGAGLVLFSGDKLLGGPQAGIIVGKRHLIEQLAQHPMSRALRVDKLTLAALQATLSLYRRGETDSTVYDEIPFLQMYRTSLDVLERRARNVAQQLTDCTQEWQIQAVPSEAFAGGGSLPGNQLASWAVAMQPTVPRHSVEQLIHQLRTATPAVVGRIHLGQLLLDLRSVLPSDDDQLLETLRAILQRG